MLFRAPRSPLEDPGDPRPGGAHPRLGPGCALTTTSDKLARTAPVVQYTYSIPRFAWFLWGSAPSPSWLAHGTSHKTRLPGGIKSGPIRSADFLAGSRPRPNGSWDFSTRSTPFPGGSPVFPTGSGDFSTRMPAVPDGSGVFPNGLRSPTYWVRGFFHPPRVLDGYRTTGACAVMSIT